MKIKKVTFTHTGEFRAPKIGEYFFNRDSYCLCTCLYPVNAHEICERTEQVDDWKPEPGQKYHTPVIGFKGKASYNTFTYFPCDKNSTDFDTIFPTAELATAEAQKWIAAAKGDND